VSDNNNDTNTKEDTVAPGTNPEDRPDLQNYMSEEQPSKRGENRNSCKYSNKTFSTMKH
jgi:hypothetical protein